MTTDNGLHLRIYSTGDEVTIVDRDSGEIYAKLYGPYRFGMAINVKWAIIATYGEAAVVRGYLGAE